jgi:hypothetical protein
MRRLRPLTELGYLAACAVLLALAWGGNAMGLFLVVTLPLSAVVLFVATIGWGALVAWMPGPVTVALWMTPPVLNVLGVRCLMRLRAQSAAAR